jgi:hypothetical protein
VARRAALSGEAPAAAPRGRRLPRLDPAAAIARPAFRLADVFRLDPGRRGKAAR